MVCARLFFALSPSALRLLLGESQLASCVLQRFLETGGGFRAMKKSELIVLFTWTQF